MAHPKTPARIKTGAGGPEFEVLATSPLTAHCEECEATAEIAGVAEVLLDATGESEGKCTGDADTECAFVGGGFIGSALGIEEDGDPLPRATFAAPTAMMLGEAAAAGFSRMQGSAPTPVPATGTIEAGSRLVYSETVIWQAEYLLGSAGVAASACARIGTGALSVNLSHAPATASFWPALMAGAADGASTAACIPTVTWDELPPR